MIVILSDSHGEEEVIASIKAQYEGKASAIIHCGDSELPADLNLWDGIHVVGGNCDYDNRYPESELIKADGKEIYMTHGHRFYVGYGLEHLAGAAKARKAEIAVFGHLHRPILEIINGVLCLNPGSVSQPRGEIAVKMYATLEVESLTGFTRYKISYRGLDHAPIDRLQFTKEVGHL